MFALHISCVPIFLDLFLCFFQCNSPGTDLFVQPILQPILLVCTGVLGIRLRPQVLNYISTAKFAADEMVNLIVPETVDSNP